MSNMRDLLDLINEMSEEQQGNAELHDEFDIELSEEVVIESGIIDINEDGILIEADDKAIELLEKHGLILEDADWSKYDEPTVKRVEKGITKLDRTDYNVPPAMRKDTKGKPGYELRKEKLKAMGAIKEEDVEESGLQAYLGNKKYGKDGMDALRKAGKDGASKEKMAKIRAKYDKLDEGPADEPVEPDMDADDKRWDDIDEAKYQGREVPLGKPMAGDVKKSKVYVKKPNGKVVKVNFGDKKMKIKKSNPKRRKSFRARHNCKNPGPRWKARYWSCRAW